MPDSSQVVQRNLPKCRRRVMDWRGAGGYIMDGFIETNEQQEIFS
jgi:hypothetical protein